MATEVTLFALKEFWFAGAAVDPEAEDNPTAFEECIDVVKRHVAELTEWYVGLTTPGQSPQRPVRPPGGREPHDRPAGEGKPQECGLEAFVDLNDLMSHLEEKHDIPSATVLKAKTGKSPTEWIQWGRQNKLEPAECLSTMHDYVCGKVAGLAKE
jgi:hypothetical protein